MFPNTHIATEQATGAVEGYATDVAAQGAVSPSLHQSFALLLGNLHEAFVLFDLSYKVQLYNEKARIFIENIFGITLTPNLSIIEAAKQTTGFNHVLQILPKVLLGEEMVREFTHDKTGRLQIFQVHYKPAYDADKKIAGGIALITDITESRLAEALIADNEERWRFALEGSSQGVWDWNMQTGEVFYSESWYHMLGYKPQEAGNLIRDWEEKLHPNEQELMRRHHLRHISGTQPVYESEFRLRAANGSYRWILSRGMIMNRSASGAPLRMIGTHTDITERKATEEKYKVLFHKNPRPMFTLDRQALRFINVNEAALRMYGYDEDTFLQLPVTAVMEMQELEALCEGIRKSAGKESKPQTHSHRKKDGGNITVSISGLKFEEAGRLVTLVTAENISAKLAAQKRLVASEALYHRLFRSIPLPAFIYDRTTLQIIEANNTAIGSYGFSRTEFAALTFPQLHPKEEQEAVGRELLTSAAHGETTVANYSHCKKDGTCIQIELWVANIDVEGKAMQLAIVQDITEKLRNEAEIKASNERYSHVLNATSDIVWDWHFGSNKVLLSEHYANVLGWELPESKLLAAHHFAENLHPDDRERVIDNLTATVFKTSGPVWENAFRYRRSDGSYAHLLGKGFIIRTGQHHVVRMIGVLHDISEQQYQQEVQELELRVFALSSKPDTSMEPVFTALAKGLNHLHDQTYNCIAWFTGKGVLQITAPDLPAAAAEWLTGFVKARGPLWDRSYVHSTGIDVYRLPQKDKALFDKWKNGQDITQVLCLPVFDADSRLLAVLLVLKSGHREFSHNVLSALHRMQNLLRILSIHHSSVQQIRQANERFDNVMKATHDLIWDWDLETGNFYRSPEGVRRVYGIRNEKKITNVHDWMGRIHTEDHAKVQQVISHILAAEAEDTFEVEYRFLRDDDTYAYLYDRGIIIRNAAGKPVRMIGAAQDVSERKKLEQELLQEELNRQKLISQATIDTQEQERGEIGKELHDNVNQILTTTKLYLDLAQSSPEMREELLAKASKNVINVINEIRQLSRSLMDPSIGDLGLIDSIRDLVENINLTGRLAVKLQADEVLNDLLGDSKKLMIFRITQEAMSNILRHAQATKVMVRLKKAGNDFATLQITDNGIGFKPEEVKSGIGLKNIRNRVYLTNGELQVIAAPGKGCTLKIKFPLQKIPQ